MTQSLAHLLNAQDQLLTRRQAFWYFTPAEVDAHLGRDWQVVLPGVYATFTGALTNRHRARAALLHAGESSMLNDVDAAALRPSVRPDLLDGASACRCNRPAGVSGLRRAASYDEIAAADRDRRIPGRAGAARNG